MSQQSAPVVSRRMLAQSEEVGYDLMVRSNDTLYSGPQCSREANSLLREMGSVGKHFLKLLDQSAFLLCLTIPPLTRLSLTRKPSNTVGKSNQNIAKLREQKGDKETYNRSQDQACRHVSVTKVPVPAWHSCLLLRTFKLARFDTFLLSLA